MRAEYHPDFSALGDVCARGDVSQVLIVGGDVDGVIDVGSVEVRRANEPQPQLQNGIYRYERPGFGAAVLAVRKAQKAGPACSVNLLEDHDHFVARTRMWFDHLWFSAVPAEEPPIFGVNDVCTLSGDDAQQVIILGVTRAGDEHRYRCQHLNDPSRVSMIAESGLKRLEAHNDDPSSWFATVPARAEFFAAGITTTKIRNPLTDTVYSYLSSKTVFRPYQFRPVLKLLASPRSRLLIADEVGLGKTIEAGLIWNELEARDRDFNRVLVVCPAALKTKWHQEMSRRFDRDVRIYDKSRLLEMLHQVEAEGDRRGFYGIVSMESLRSEDVLGRLQEVYPLIDLVIVDEAHSMRNSETATHAAGMVLGSLARSLVFLSATPVNLHDRDLYHLLQILVPDEFQSYNSFLQQVEPNRHVNAASQLLRLAGTPPTAIADALSQVHGTELGDTVAGRWEYDRVMKLCRTKEPLDPGTTAEVKRHLSNLNTFSSVLTRTRKVDVPGAKAVREPREIHVELTEPEQALLQEVTKRIRRSAELSNGVPGFAAQMPLRQSTSCMPVTIDRIQRGDHSWEIDDDLAEEFDTIDAEMNGTVLIVDEDVEAIDAEKLSLEHLARRVGTTDTKFDEFLRCLCQAEEIGSARVMVFSFFRRTLEYLHERLSAEGISSRYMHGGVPPADRDAIIAQFRANKFQVLLSSEVGSEGLDFEFCNVLVNYDLPWNPMKVEQRIGRLDRFGQEHEKIFIFNFQIPGTIDTDIFERLYRRIGVFHDSIGELEPIMRDEFNSLTKLALSPTLSDAQREQRLKEIADAVEERRLQLADLESDTSLVNGAGNALIEGFESDPEAGGRFVGPNELLELLRRFSAATKQLSVRPGSTDERVSIIGTAELASAVRRARFQRSGSRYTTTVLAGMLENEDPIELTISNEDASRTNTDLLSIRHPIVRVAADYFADMPKQMWRFGSVRLPEGQEPDEDCLASMYLVETTGIRPRLEIWSFAASLSTGRIVDGVGDAVLRAVATGQLRDGSSTVPAGLERAHLSIEELMFHKEQTERAKAIRDNSAEVSRQISVQRAKVRAERKKREELLNNPALDASMKRLHLGAIRNAQERLDDVVAELERKRGLTMMAQLLAFAVVAGKAHEGSAR